MSDPKPGFAAVQKENPQMTDGLMAYSYATMKSMQLIENEDTAKGGIGIMTDARWKQHFDTLVAGKLFAPDFDYKSSYTLQFLAPKEQG
jgi:NitT/TauT family transport system substrate-binding protein